MSNPNLPLAIFRRLPLGAAALILSILCLPGVAPVAEGADWVTDQVGARLVGADGVELYRTAHEVVGERIVEVTAADVSLLLWNERPTDADETSHYAILKADGSLLGRVRQVTYDVGLVRNTFDPLKQSSSVRETHLRARPDNRIFLVQSWVPPFDALQEQVRAAGGAIHRYLTDHTMIVEMDGATRAEVASMPFVRWVGEYHPAYRVEPPLRPLLRSGPNVSDAAAERYSIMVFERGPRQKEELGNAIRALGGTVESITPQGFRMDASLTPGQLAELVHDNRLQYVDKWGPMETDMDNVRIVGGADYVETETGYTGQGVRGEIFDTEIRLTHQEWDAARIPIVHSPGTSGGFHGTGVLSNVFAIGTDAAARGMCPSGQPIFFRASDSIIFGGAISRYTINAELIDPLGTYRAVFQTSSVGSPRTFFYTTISAETDDYLFQHQILSTQSQSNAGNQDSRPQAWAKNIVAVGGFRHFGNADRSDDRWGFSGSIGPADDGRIKPDLSFYYDGIFAAHNSSDTAYTQFGGTSSATPQTAGHFGLLFQMWHEGTWAGFGGGTDVFDSRPQMMTAKALMINNAHQYDWNVVGPNDDIDRFKQGWGTADVRNLLDNASGTTIIDETEILEQGDSYSDTVSLPSGADQLKVTMAYVDPMGTPGATEHRINDLTLKVTSPGGLEEYWGNNGLDAGLVSTSGGTANTVDTVENVFIANAAPGDWTVEVFADEVVQDAHVETVGTTDADFALIITVIGEGIFADGFESGDVSAWTASVP